MKTTSGAGVRSYHGRAPVCYEVLTAGAARRAENSAKFHFISLPGANPYPAVSIILLSRKPITTYRREVSMVLNSSRRRGRLQTLLTPALLALAVSFVAPIGHAQSVQNQQKAPDAAAAQGQATPLYKEYKGVRLGMSADEVRQKLGRPKESGKEQDFFIFSDSERARVYYDTAHKATAIISTFVGKASNAPTPEAVLGTAVEAKPDGTVYQVVRYPEAGYWVAYSRTTGDEPLTMITMQAMPGGAK